MPELAEAWEEAGPTVGLALETQALSSFLLHTDPKPGCPGVEVIYASEVMLRRHSSGHQQSEESSESKKEQTVLGHRRRRVPPRLRGSNL